VEVELGAHVQLARGRMPVERSFQALWIEDLAQAADILRQALGTHTHVLDARGGLCRTRAPRHQGQACLAHPPHHLLPNLVAQGEPAHPESQALELAQVVADVVEELHQQHGLTRRLVEPQQLARRSEGELAPGLVEEQPVDVLDGGRLEGQQHEGGQHGLVHRVEEDHAQTALSGHGDHSELGSGDDGQSALAAGDQAGQVPVIAEVGVETIARPALDQPRGQPLLDLPGNGLDHVIGSCAELGEAFAITTDRCHPAVGQHQIEGRHVLHGGAVHRRMGTRGVVGDHAAEGRPGAGGHIRSKAQ